MTIHQPQWLHTLAPFHCPTTCQTDMSSLSSDRKLCWSIGQRCNTTVHILLFSVSRPINPQKCQRIPESDHRCNVHTTRPHMRVGWTQSGLMITSISSTVLGIYDGKKEKKRKGENTMALQIGMAFVTESFFFLTDSQSFCYGKVVVWPLCSLHLSASPSLPATKKQKQRTLYTITVLRSLVIDDISFGVFSSFQLSYF